MANCIRATIAILLWVSSTVSAAPIVKSVAFLIYDADTNSQIPAVVIVDNDKLTNGVFQLPEDQDSRIALSVTAEAGEKYYSRTITIFLEGINVSKPAFKIYLAQKQKDYVYTRGAIRKAAEFINNEFADRAVALLERIDNESPQTLIGTQFGIYLKYNLARAYINNCTQKFVEQCNQGKDILLELNRNFDKYSKFLVAESITKNDLENNTADNHYKRMEYLRAVWNISTGRPEEAMRALDGLIDEANQNSALTSTLKRTLEGLKSDRELAEERLRALHASSH